MNLLRTGFFLPLAVCGMEAAWLSLLSGWVTGQTGPALPPHLVLALVAAAAFSTRWLLARDFPLTDARVYALASAGISLLLVVRLWYYAGTDPFSIGWIAHIGAQAMDFFQQAPRLGLGLLAGAFAWYRGVTIGRSALSTDNVPAYFLHGSVALVVLSLVRAAWPAAEAMPAAAYVLLFFGCGLTALALARLREVSGGGTDVPPALQRQWMGVLLASSSVTLGVAVIATGIVAVQSLTDLTRLAGNIVSLVLVVLVLLTVPIVWLAEYLVYAFRWLMALLGVVPPPEPPQLVVPPSARELTEPEEMEGLPPELIAIIQLALLLLVLGVLAAFLAFAIFRRRPGEEEVESEEHESFWSWHEAWADFMRVLRTLWVRVTARFRKLMPEDSGSEQAMTQEPAARSVREVYRAMLGWAAERGLPRRREQTPNEYLEYIAQRLPEGPEEVTVITKIYVAARYGRFAVDQAGVEGARQAWERLRHPHSESHGNGP